MLSGQPAQYVQGLTRAGYSLDAIAQANNLGAKTGHGAEAPKLWKQGKYQEVIDYCKNDVLITRRLLDLLESDRVIIDPTTGENLDQQEIEAWII